MAAFLLQLTTRYAAWPIFWMCMRRALSRIGVPLMRILVTGHRGYIGTLMAPFLADAGHEVVGADSDLFEPCTFGSAPREFPSLHKDIRDFTAGDLEGFEAVIHLAGLSNDPLGNLNPDLTYDINHRASVRLAQLGKQAGVSRFLFA